MSRLGSAARLLAPLLVLLAQSPFAQTSLGAAVSPLQVLARYVDKMTSAGEMERTSWLSATLQLMLFPGNILRHADPLAVLQNATARDEVWAQGIALAVERTESYAELAHPEVCLGACLCIVFFSCVSLLLRRVHLVQLFGYALFCSFLFTNSLFPTLQAAACLSCALSEMNAAAASQRADAIRAEAARIAAAAPAAVAGGRKKAN